VKFLIDVNLPPSLVRELRAAGHDCDHVSTRLGTDTEDIDIARAANEMGAVLMSKDIDFVDLVRRRVLLTSLVHIRLGNMETKPTCAIIVAQLPQIVAAIELGERVVEIR
jgi:predicted nuclease of predicted toxin-antitoxin system